MNTTVLALQEEQVLVAVGKSGAQPSVQALYSAPAHGGGMENWEKAIGALWQQHRLPTRGITLNNTLNAGSQIYPGGGFEVTGANTATVACVIAGAGPFTKRGTGTLV